VGPDYFIQYRKKGEGPGESSSGEKGELNLSGEQGMQKARYESKKKPTLLHHLVDREGRKKREQEKSTNPQRVGPHRQKRKEGAKECTCIWEKGGHRGLPQRRSRRFREKAAGKERRLPAEELPFGGD